MPKGTVLFSNDGGLHFKTVNASALANIDFVSQTDGWATTVSNQFSNKLLHTSDGGRTWKTTSDLPKRSTSAKEQQPYEGSPVSVSFADPKHGMVLRTGQPGVGQQPKTLTSTSNGGKTWSIISSVAMDGKGQTNPHQLSSGGYAKGIDTVPGHPKTAYIWESRGPLLKSTDGGQTWSASKLTPPAEIEAASVSMINKRIGYVLVHDMLPHQHRFILERTTDSMKSWTKIHHWQ